MNTQLDDHIDTDPTMDLPRTEVPVAPAVATGARRFDRSCSPSAASVRPC